MLLLLVTACLPPILLDTGMVSDTAVTGDSDDTSDSADPIDDADSDGYLAGPASTDDCDDADPAVHPGAEEILDWIDGDCDGSVVEAAQDFAGHDLFTAVGFISEVAAFPPGDDRIAAGFPSENAVRITTTVDLADGSIDGGKDITFAAGVTFGFDVLSCDLDADGGVDLVVGDPSYGAYWVVPGDVLDEAVASILAENLDILYSTDGSIGFAAAQVGERLAVTVSSPGTTVYLLEGADVLASGGSVERGVAVSSDSLVDGFGASLAALDVNGDGIAELIAGAPGGGRGSVYLFDGGMVSTVTSALTTGDADIGWTGAVSGSPLGGETLGAGRVNDDGYDDVFIASYVTDEGKSRTFYTMLGAANPASGAAADVAMSSVTEIQGFTADAAVNFPSAAAADLDGDLKAELIIGSPGESPGRVYVFSGDMLGGPGVFTGADAPVGIQGQEPDDNFGQVIALAGLGDANPLALVAAPGQSGGVFWTFPLAF